MTTTSAYLQVINNLPRMQTMTANQPAVKTATNYYQANIANVKSVSDLVGNYRLLSYALTAFGLGDQVNSTALITKVLQGGVTNPKSLANTLANPQWKAFASAFSYLQGSTGGSPSSSNVSAVVGDYVEQQLENNQGQQDVGVQLALYFQRVAPTITSEYGVLGDKNLLQVVQTIFNLPPQSSAANIDTQANELSQLMPVSELQDPAKLQQLTERFTAMYDLKYGPASGSTSSLTVSGDGSTSQVSAASTILSGVIDSNGSVLAPVLAADNLTPLFSSSLLSSLQNFQLGG